MAANPAIQLFEDPLHQPKALFVCQQKPRLGGVESVGLGLVRGVMKISSPMTLFAHPERLPQAIFLGVRFGIHEGICCRLGGRDGRSQDGPQLGTGEHIFV